MSEKELVAEIKGQDKLITKQEQTIAQLRTDYDILLKSRNRLIDSYKKTVSDLAAAEKENTRLEEIIIRFKAGCKVTNREHGPENCFMVIDMQADLKRHKEALEKRPKIMLKEDDWWICFGENAIVSGKTILQGRGNIVRSNIVKFVEQALNPKETK